MHHFRRRRRTCSSSDVCEWDAWHLSRSQASTAPSSPRRAGHRTIKWSPEIPRSLPEGPRADRQTRSGIRLTISECNRNTRRRTGRLDEMNQQTNDGSSAGEKNFVKQPAMRRKLDGLSLNDSLPPASRAPVRRGASIREPPRVDRLYALSEDILGESEDRHMQATRLGRALANRSSYRQGRAVATSPRLCSASLNPVNPVAANRCLHQLHRVYQLRGVLTLPRRFATSRVKTKKSTDEPGLIVPTTRPALIFTPTPTRRTKRSAIPDAAQMLGRRRSSCCRSQPMRQQYRAPTPRVAPGWDRPRARFSCV